MGYAMAANGRMQYDYKQTNKPLLTQHYGHLRLQHQQKHFCLGGMASSEWMRFIRAVRETTVADSSLPGVDTTRRVAYRPPIAVSPFLLALSVSYCTQTIWRCGQL